MCFDPVLITNTIKIKGMENKGKTSSMSNGRPLIFLGVLFLALFLSACNSNVIEFDINTNTVYTVDKYPISSLHVIMEKSNMNFWISKVDTLEGSSRIQLDSLGKNYKIEKDKPYHTSSDWYNNIPFVPNEIYEIRHCSIGDAAQCVIYIFTDENSKVKEVMTRYEYEKRRHTGPVDKHNKRTVPL